MDNIAEVMEAERQRLTKRLEEIAERRVQLDQEVDAIETELHGIQAYLDAKMGKVTTRQATNTRKAPSAPRGPRKTGVKQQVLDVITAEGISKQDILAKLGAVGNKSLEQAISNSLVALKKDEKIVSGERGSYKLAPTKETPPPADTKPKRVPKTEAQPS